MNITEVRVKLTADPRNKLKAFCSITFDDAFVVRDLKIIEGAKGPFIAMPSRKLSDRCGRCSNKNHLRAQYCNQCGGELDPDRAMRDMRGRARLHADLAHPINSTCRIGLQKTVVAAYQEEVELSQEEGYKAPSFEDFDEEFIDEAYIQDLQRGTKHADGASADGAGEAQAGGGIEQEA